MATKQACSLNVLTVKFVHMIDVLDVVLGHTPQPLVAMLYVKIGLSQLLLGGGLH